ncbi:PREDICTED: serine/threonine-protein kinase ATM [Tarenaya hassleriana]|uniref:serine/threonine-protein kinase ATM n=1 Tax=Tarenaya hassleriana TaxID=28532 RepID=UPI00053C7663|nr:PREDICTED: serine/threonine-protein kinase ATM [Tarenaya hassleriana]
MKQHDPDAKTLEETSGSSEFFSFSQESDGMASDFEVHAPESTGGLGLDCVGPTEAIDSNAGDIGGAVENFPANEGSKEENEGLLSRDDDTVRKIQVSGENLSLVVDFSGSLTVLSRQNGFDSSGSSLTANVKKENGEGDEHLGFVVGDIVWVLTKYQTCWPGEVVDFRAGEKESLLVRYFDQSHVSLWLAPSRLRPFNQNIEYMLKQGKGKSFTRAVEKVVALLGDSLKFEMTCPCIRKEHDESRKLKSSSLSEFSVDRMEPEEFVARLKNLAKCSSVSGILELTVMQSRLSVFYSFNGHKQIPVDQLCEDDAGKRCPVPAKQKAKKKIQEGAVKRKMPADKSKDLSSIQGMGTQVSGLGNNVGDIDIENQSSSVSRNRKRSKYLSYPFVGSKATEGEKAMESTNQFIGSSSTVTGSIRKRFQREWFRKFMSEEGNASVRAELAGVSLSDLISELRLLAINYRYSKETDHFGLTEWFFSKFRMSMFHDEHIYEKQFKNDMILAKETTPDAGQDISKTECLAKSNIRPDNGLSDVKSVPGTDGFCPSYSQEGISVQTLSEKSPEADAPSRPATLVPELNNGSTTLNFVEPGHSQGPNISVLPEVSKLGGETRPMMLNFQVTGPCSTDNISGAGFVFVQPVSGIDLNLSKTDLSTHFTDPGQTKRKRKRKRKEEPPLATTETATGIPDLNGLAPDATSPLPQEKPVQRRRRRKKEELSNGETKGTTILVMKFISGDSLPSKDDLTSKFAGFGPLDATETHVSTDSGSAQVAFMSSGDAIEAVKSLEKTNPFGETLTSFRLQQKPAATCKKVAPRMPVISVSSGSRPREPPMSVEMIRQNLMMMTSMLERSGDSLSEEMRVKLRREITGLLEKVSSMP